MKAKWIWACAALAATGAFAREVSLADLAPELTIKADVMAADNLTGNVVASGHVSAALAPYRFYADSVEKRGDDYCFNAGTQVTTCSNEVSSLHWCGSGEVVYRTGRYVLAKNMVLRAWGCPVLWLPYWYYPMDTNYGLRMMPGYTSRWGAYLLTRYVHPIAGDFQPGHFGLSGDVRVDWRYRNGLAFGDTLNWQLGEAGRGFFKMYYAWDEDADRYDRHWLDNRKWHYSNWSNRVPYHRYGFVFKHDWQISPRDRLWARASFYSDREFRHDFMRSGYFGAASRYPQYDGNELVWEHHETIWNGGVAVSGPLNDFYGGSMRLPEAWWSLLPQPVFGTHFLYENDTRLGWLNRDYAKFGDAHTALPYRYNPGPWADYQAFRFDTYHRVTRPFRIADLVSVVPRLGFRGTFWSASGLANLDGASRAYAERDDVWRLVYESGITFSARGVSEASNGWRHIIEPYADVLAQWVEYAGLGASRRPLIFDSRDASRDWLDQFAGASRNLPYSWQGLTPGFRQTFRKTDETGRSRTIWDVDLYAAVQLNDTDWTTGSRYHRLTRRVKDPNYGKRTGETVPGLAIAWRPQESAALRLRTEYDVENNALAYADVSWRQELTERVKLELSYSLQDHRAWDYASSPYVASAQRGEDFNWYNISIVELQFMHEICDAWAWGPYVSWDCHSGELDEAGTWIDFRTDCLGFRLSVEYENDYVRIDGSRRDDDWRVGFYIYLRAMGTPDNSHF